MSNRIPNQSTFRNPDGRTWDLLESVNESIISPEGGDTLEPSALKTYIVDVSDCNRLTAFAVSTAAIKISIRAYFEEEEAIDFISLDRQYSNGQNMSCQAIVGGMSKVAVVVENVSTEAPVTIKVKVYKSIL